MKMYSPICVLCGEHKDNCDCNQCDSCGIKGCIRHLSNEVFSEKYQSLKIKMEVFKIQMEDFREEFKLRTDNNFHRCVICQRIWVVPIDCEEQPYCNCQGKDCDNPPILKKFVNKSCIPDGYTIPIFKGSD